MIQILFRLILNPDKKQFELTIGQDPTLVIKNVPMWDANKPFSKQWDLTALQIEQMVRNARKQLIDATDAMTEFNLEPGDYKINLKGVNSKQAFQAIVEYLEKVWNSFRGSKYYVEVYPQ